jgi:hypothetical protein
VTRARASWRDRRWMQWLADTLPPSAECRVPRRHVLAASYCGRFRERITRADGRVDLVAKVCERSLCPYCSTRRAEITEEVLARLWSDRATVTTACLRARRADPAAALELRDRAADALREAECSGWIAVVAPGRVWIFSDDHDALRALRPLRARLSRTSPATAAKRARTAIADVHAHLSRLLAERTPALRADPWLGPVRRVLRYGTSRAARGGLPWPRRDAIRALASADAAARRDEESGPLAPVVRSELLDSLRDGAVISVADRPQSISEGVSALERRDRRRRESERRAFAPPLARPPG